MQRGPRAFRVLLAVNEQVETCNRKAFECETKALVANTVETRCLYWRLAGLWRDIARLSADPGDEREWHGAQSA